MQTIIETTILLLLFILSIEIKNRLIKWVKVQKFALCIFNNQTTAERQINELFFDINPEYLLQKHSKENVVFQ